MVAPTAPRGRRGEALFRWLHALGSGCGKLPLVAGVALVLSARAVPLFAQPEVPRVIEPGRFAATPPDAALIDSVLAKRAPELASPCAGRSSRPSPRRPAGRGMIRC